MVIKQVTFSCPKCGRGTTALWEIDGWIMCEVCKDKIVKKEQK